MTFSVAACGHAIYAFNAEMERVQAILPCTYCDETTTRAMYNGRRYRRRGVLIGGVIVDAWVRKTDE